MGQRWWWRIRGLEIFGAGAIIRVILSSKNNNRYYVTQTFSITVGGGGNGASVGLGWPME